MSASDIQPPAWRGADPPVIRPPIQIDAPIDLPSVSLRDILRTALRRRWPMLGILLGAILASLAYLAIESASYTANTKVMVRVGREKLSTLTLPQISAGNFIFNERAENVNDEIEIMRSAGVMQRDFPVLRGKLEELAAAAPPPSPLRQVINFGKDTAREAVRLALWPLRAITGRRDLAPEEALYEQLSRSLLVAPVRETNVFAVGFSWGEPHFAAFALNTILDAFVQEHIRIQSAVAQAADFYRDRAAMADADLAALNAEVEAHGRRVGTPDPISEKGVVLSLTTNLERDMAQARVAEDQARRRAEELRRIAATDSGWPGTPAVPNVQLTQLSDLDTRYAELATRRTAALTQLRPTAREVRDLDQQIETLRRQKFAALLAYFEDRATTEQEMQRAIATRLEESRARLQQLQVLEAQFVQLQSRREQMLLRAREYRQQIDHLGLLRALDNAQQISARVLSPALPPLLPTWPRAGLLLGIALGLGLLLAVAYTVFAEFFDRTVSTERDAERVLGIPVVARLPDLRR